MRGLYLFMKQESESSLVFWFSEGVKAHFQASAAFLLEPFVLASAPSAFLEPLGGRLPMEAEVVFVVSRLTSWTWWSVPSSSSCSRQHSCPVGGQGRRAPSW